VIAQNTSALKIGRPGLIANRTASIETTAYALLSLTLHKDNLDAGKAAKWLVSQRNAYGGYGSTQDTSSLWKRLPGLHPAPAPISI